VTTLLQIVDGLDSVEQRKILTVLDTVHGLFSDPGLPFIIILAIDPHVIIKVTRLNVEYLFVKLLDLTLYFGPGDRVESEPDLLRHIHWRQRLSQVST
jgi:hypothetical protein